MKKRSLADVIIYNAFNQKKMKSDKSSIPLDDYINEILVNDIPLIRSRINEFNLQMLRNENKFHINFIHGYCGTGKTSFIASSLLSLIDKTESIGLIIDISKYLSEHTKHGMDQNLYFFLKGWLKWLPLTNDIFADKIISDFGQVLSDFHEYLLSQERMDCIYPVLDKIYDYLLNLKEENIRNKISKNNEVNNFNNTKYYTKFIEQLDINEIIPYVFLFFYYLHRHLCNSERIVICFDSLDSIEIPSIQSQFVNPLWDSLSKMNTIINSLYSLDESPEYEFNYTFKIVCILRKENYQYLKGDQSNTSLFENSNNFDIGLYNQKTYYSEILRRRINYWIRTTQVSNINVHERNFIFIYNYLFNLYSKIDKLDDLNEMDINDIARMSLALLNSDIRLFSVTIYDGLEKLKFDLRKKYNEIKINGEVNANYYLNGIIRKLIIEQLAKNANYINPFVKLKVPERKFGYCDPKRVILTTVSNLIAEQNVKRCWTLQ